MVCIAGKSSAQLGVLCGDTDRAGVEVAFTHQDAPFDDEGGGGQSPFFGAEQCGYGDIATGFHLSVGLKDDPAAELVFYESLVRFGETQFPGQTCMTDGADG